MCASTACSVDTPDAASEAIGIGPCLPPSFELGHGNGDERVLPVVVCVSLCVSVSVCVSKKIITFTPSL